MNILWDEISDCKARHRGVVGKVLREYALLGQYDGTLESAVECMTMAGYAIQGPSVSLFEAVSLFPGHDHVSNPACPEEWDDGFDWSAICHHTKGEFE